MKRFSIGLVAVLMAIGFAAFTTPKTAIQKKTGLNLYRYNDNATDIKNPLNYVWVSSMSGQCSGAAEIVCIIEAPGNAGSGEHPDFTNGTDPYDNQQDVTVKAERAEPQ